MTLLPAEEPLAVIVDQRCCTTVELS